jgi:cobalt-zinc-cadmium efflux system protein
MNQTGPIYLAGVDFMHVHTSKNMSRQLLLALLFTCILSAFEFVGGQHTNSRALTADAAHIFLDGLAVALAWISTTAGRNNLYIRSGCTLLNACLLLFTSCQIAWDTLPVFLHPRTVIANQTILVAIISLVLNLLILQRLTHGKHDANIRAAALHVLGDMIASIGVIVSSAFVLLTGYDRVDSIVAVGVSIYLMSNGWSLLAMGVRMMRTRQSIPLQLYLSTIKDSHRRNQEG